jgi:uncharacterized membrane protein YdjX (TVP38/TMEM64 family)
MIPAMLPPPTPMKLIVLAAGAFEMRVSVFMLAMFLGRVLRFSIVSYLVVHFGERVIEQFNAGIRQKLPWVLAFVAALAIAGYLVMRRKKVPEIAR